MTETEPVIGFCWSGGKNEKMSSRKMKKQKKSACVWQFFFFKLNGFRQADSHSGQEVKTQTATDN